jgi:hypothetical protein
MARSLQVVKCIHSLGQCRCVHIVRCVLMDKKSVIFSLFKKSEFNALEEKIRRISDVEKIVGCAESDSDSVTSLIFGRYDKRLGLGRRLTIKLQRNNRHHFDVSLLNIRRLNNWKSLVSFMSVREVKIVTKSFLSLEENLCDTCAVDVALFLLQLDHARACVCVSV